jgi:hypothetical protein
MTPFHWRKLVLASPATHQTSSSSSAAGAPLSPLHYHHHPSLQHVVKNTETSLERYHRQLAAEVEYSVEAILGRHCLPELLRQLKQLCCEASLAADRRSLTAAVTLDVVQAWKAALLLYRDMYNCLLHRGQDAACCLFFEK